VISQIWIKRLVVQIWGLVSTFGLRGEASVAGELANLLGQRGCMLDGFGRLDVLLPVCLSERLLFSVSQCSKTTHSTPLYHTHPSMSLSLSLSLSVPVSVSLCPCLCLSLSLSLSHSLSLSLMPHLPTLNLVEA